MPWCACREPLRANLPIVSSARRVLRLLRPARPCILNYWGCLLVSSEDSIATGSRNHALQPPCWCVYKTPAVSATRLYPYAPFCASVGMSTFSTRGGLYERAQKRFGVADGKRLFTYAFFEKRRLDALVSPASTSSSERCYISAHTKCLKGVSAEQLISGRPAQCLCRLVRWL